MDSLNVVPPLTLRPICEGDLPFLCHLYGSTRAAELAQTDWSDAQKRAFVAMQFEAQHRYYQAQYAGARFELLLRGGEPVGRLYVARWPDQLRIIDIALLPEQRGQGIGTALLRALLAEGQASALPVTIHVEQFNPALSLYGRLGFQRVSAFGVYWLLRWEPSSSEDAWPG